MALIKCPECGQEISEYADKCTGCGCPMSKIKELIESQRPAKEETNDFLSKITKEQREFIASIVSELSRDYENEKIISIRETDDGFFVECLNKKNAKCIFRAKGGVMFVSYYNEGGFKKDSLTITEYNSGYQAKAIRIVEKMLQENEPDAYVKKQEEKGSTKYKHYFNIFPSIKKEMNDKPYYAPDKEKAFCKELRKFLLDILSMDSPKKLVSPTFACPHHTFFGHKLRWDTSDGYRSTAIVYFYYKSVKIVDEIRNYEKIMNIKIIEDNGYQKLLDSLYHQFDKKCDISLSNCDGVTSNISFVPNEAIYDVLEQFQDFEK